MSSPRPPFFKQKHLTRRIFGWTDFYKNADNTSNRDCRPYESAVKEGEVNEKDRRNWATAKGKKNTYGEEELSIHE